MWMLDGLKSLGNGVELLFLNLKLKFIYGF